MSLCLLVHETVTYGEEYLTGFLPFFLSCFLSSLLYFFIILHLFLAIHLLLFVWVFFTSWLLWINMQLTWEYEHFLEILFWIVLGQYPGVQQLDLLVVQLFVFWGNHSGCTVLYFHQQSPSFQFCTSWPALCCFQFASMCVWCCFAFIWWLLMLNTISYQLVIHVFYFRNIYSNPLAI